MKSIYTRDARKKGSMLFPVHFGVFENENEMKMICFGSHY